MSDITSKPIEWLWHGKIARGKFTVIAGHPGIGKSQLSANLTSIVSIGGTFPDGTKCTPGGVVILSAEDSAEDTIKPRLEVTNADLEKIILITAVNREETNTQSSKNRLLNLEQDILLIDQLLAEQKAAGNEITLLTIDPISSYLGKINGNDNSAVRGLLAPVCALAEKYNIAIIGISHLSKGKNANAETSALMRVMGSLGFVAAARAAFLVTKDPHDEKKRLFLFMKNNLGRDSGGYSFTIEQKIIAVGIEPSYIVWSKEPISTTADEAIGLLGDDDKGAIDEACDFLRDLLNEGTAFQKDVKIEAENAGISVKTLYRAKGKLKIISDKIKGDKHGAWFWRLPTEKEIIKD